MIRGEGDQADGADLGIIKRIPQEGGKVSHRTTRWSILGIETHAGIKVGKSVTRHGVEDAG